MKPLAHSHHTLALLTYLATVLGVSLVHSPIVLAGLLGLALIAAGRTRWRLLRRSVLAGLGVTLCVGGGYAVMSLAQGEFHGVVVLRLTLRVVLLTFLGCWFVSLGNLLRALAFSSSLTRLAAIAAGQVGVFTTLARDYWLASISRSGGRRLTWTQRWRQSAALSAQLMDKAVANAEQNTRALRARGAFDD